MCVAACKIVIQLLILYIYTHFIIPLINLTFLLMELTEYEELKDYLLYQKYPDSFKSKALKRNFRRKSLKFRISGENNILYQVSKQYNYLLNLLFGRFYSFYWYRK